MRVIIKITIISVITAVCVGSRLIQRTNTGDLFTGLNCAEFDAEDFNDRGCRCVRDAEPSKIFGTLVSKNARDKVKCYYNDQQATGCQLRLIDTPGLLIPFTTNQNDIVDKDVYKDKNSVLTNSQCTKLDVKSMEVWSYAVAWRSLTVHIAVTTKKNIYQLKWTVPPDQTSWNSNFKGNVIRVNLNCTLVTGGGETQHSKYCLAFKVAGDRSTPPSTVPPTTSTKATKVLPTTSTKATKVSPRTSTTPTTTSRTPTTTSNPLSPSTTDKPTNNGAIIGAVFGGILLIMVILAVVYLCVRRKKEKQRIDSERVLNNNMHAHHTEKRKPKKVGRKRSEPNHYSMSETTNKTGVQASDYLAPVEVMNNEKHSHSVWTRVKKSFHGRNPLANYKENPPVPVPRQPPNPDKSSNSRNARQSIDSDIDMTTQPPVTNRRGRPRNASYDNPSKYRKSSSSSRHELLDNSSEYARKISGSELSNMKKIVEISDPPSEIQRPNSLSTEHPHVIAPRRISSAKQHPQSANQQSLSPPQVSVGNDRVYSQIPTPEINIISPPKVGRERANNVPVAEPIYDKVPRTPEQKHMQLRSMESSGTVNSGWSEDEFDNSDDADDLQDVQTIQRPKNSVNYGYQNSASKKINKRPLTTPGPVNSSPGYRQLNVQQNNNIYEELQPTRRD